MINLQVGDRIIIQGMKGRIVKAKTIPPSESESGWTEVNITAEIDTHEDKKEKTNKPLHSWD